VHGTNAIMQTCIHHYDTINTTSKISLAWPDKIYYLCVKTQSNTPKLRTFQVARKFKLPEVLAICHMTNCVVGKEEI